MNIHSLIITSLAILPLSATVHAQDLCGGYLEKGSKQAMLLDKYPTISCHIATTKKDCHISFSAKLRKGSYLGDTLRLNRKSIKDPWVIRLQLGGGIQPQQGNIDITKDMSMTIGNNDPILIPAKFLSRGSYKLLKGRAYIDTKFNKSIIDQLKTAKTAKITATDEAGNDFTSTFKEKYFKDVKKVFDWADCMQKAQ
jgi:hypothetical protein